ncbi:MAG: hypothetical protein LBH64_00350, partial [Coriobacteriales bacterium]|nr:hypothetical protein [Coriobacteriales bacterium]
MEKLIRLAGANIRKSMGQAVSLFVFILIAAALLNVGLLMLLSFGTSFDKRAEELHTPHYAIMEPETTYTEEQLAWFVNHPDTTETEKETIYSFATDVTYNEGEMIMFLNFLDAEAPRSMNDLSLMDGSAPRAADEVCLPYLFKVGGGYKLGDRFSFTYKEHTLDYRISGFSEDMLFGTNTIQLFRIFLSAEGFANLAQELPQTRSVFLTTRTVDPATSERLHQDFIQEFFYREAIPEAEALLINSIDIISAKRACTF